MESLNSEPNKRLRLTPPLALRGAGTIIAARQSGPRQNTGRWARVRRILTTEYTEAVDPYLKNTEMDSVYSVWERSDLSVKFCGKKVGG